MKPDEVAAVLADPLARELLASDIPARMAYVALDGTPRVVPIGFVWDGSRWFTATHPKAPKVAALRAHPAVAMTIDTNEQPAHVLLIRGTAEVQIVDGVPPEFLAASKKLVPAQQWAQFAVTVTALYEQMALIQVQPTWAKLLDFVTRVPDAIADAARS